jgi:ABC-type lipoprotein export system ATPase subunit
MKLFNKDTSRQQKTDKNRPADAQEGPIIELHKVNKTYVNASGGFQALNEVDIEIGRGEFVGIIGRSGSGKSTLINMITGIDRPTSGDVLVGNQIVNQMSENQIARWRGRNLGVVFQFFQLLPNLTVIENVMLPMDFCNMYVTGDRRKRALKLLEMVDMAGHAYKLPAALSGGQQQRVAIARALANDPSVIIADEPTGNLDSKSADAVFKLFETLTAEGKTVVMVTHDSSLARRVSRTILIVDGEVVNEYVIRALPSISPQLLLAISKEAQPVTYPPGATIIQEGQPGEKFYMIVSGSAEVVLTSPTGGDVVVERLERGQYFGEISLANCSRTIASVRALPDASIEVLALDGETFQNMLAESQDFRNSIQSMAQTRITRSQGVSEGPA